MKLKEEDPTNLNRPESCQPTNCQPTNSKKDMANNNEASKETAKIVPSRTNKVKKVRKNIIYLLE